MAGIQKYDHAGGAAPTELSAAINSTVTAFTVTAGGGSSYPTGGVDGRFVLVIDRGTATEEKVLCDSRSGDTFTVNTSGRGFDGTSAHAHEAGAKVEHCLAAVEIDDMNTMLAKVTTKGQIPIGDGTSWSMLPAGANNTVPIADNTTATGYRAGFITGAMIQDLTVTENDLASSVAGAGLSGAAGSPLAVNVDGSTLEISSDALRIKAGGVTSNEILAGTIGLAKIASEAWPSYTPTATNVTVGNGVYACSYIKIGRIGIVNFRFNFGSTTSFTGTPIFSLPSGWTMATGNEGDVFPVQIYDTTPATRYYGHTFTNSLTTIGIQVDNVAATYPTATFVSATVPMTWANGDVISSQWIVELTA